MIHSVVKLRLTVPFFKTKYFFTTTEKITCKKIWDGVIILFHCDCCFNTSILCDKLTIGIIKPINTIPPIKGFFQMLFYNLVIYLKIPKPWNHVHYCVQRQYICYQNYQGSEITGRKINHISSLCQLMLILLVIKQNLCLKWDKLNSLLDKLYRNVVTLYDLICNCINVQK